MKLPPPLLLALLLAAGPALARREVTQPQPKLGHHHHWDKRALVVKPPSDSSEELEETLALVTASLDATGLVDAERRHGDLEQIVKALLDAISANSHQLSEILSHVPVLGEMSLKAEDWEFSEHVVSYINEAIAEPGEAAPEVDEMEKRKIADPKLMIFTIVMLGMTVVTFEVFDGEYFKENIAKILEMTLTHFGMVASSGVPLAGIFFAALIAAATTKMKDAITGEKTSKAAMAAKVLYAGIGGIHPALATAFAAAGVGNIVNGLFATIEPKCPALVKAEMKIESSKEAEEEIEKAETEQVPFKQKKEEIEQSIVAAKENIAKETDKYIAVSGVAAAKAKAVEDLHTKSDSQDKAMKGKDEAAITALTSAMEITAEKAAQAADAAAKEEALVKEALLELHTHLQENQAAILALEGKIEVHQTIADCLKEKGEADKASAASLFSGTVEIVKDELTKVGDDANFGDPETQPEDLAPSTVKPEEKWSTCLKHNTVNRQEKFKHLKKMVEDFIVMVKTDLPAKAYQVKLATQKAVEDTTGAQTVPQYLKEGVRNIWQGTPGKVAELTEYHAQYHEYI